MPLTLVLIVNGVLPAIDPESPAPPGLKIIHCQRSVKDVVASADPFSPYVIIADRPFLEDFHRGMEDRLQTESGALLVCVVRSGTDDEEYIALIVMGCRGIIETSTDQHLLRKVIAAVTRGEIWAPRGLISETINRLLGEVGPKFTARERQIVELRGRGYTNAHVADELGISRDTVKWHLRCIHAKLRSFSTAQQVLRGIVRIK